MCGVIIPKFVLHLDVEITTNALTLWGIFGRRKEFSIFSQDALILESTYTGRRLRHCDSWLLQWNMVGVQGGIKYIIREKITKITSPDYMTRNEDV